MGSSLLYTNPLRELLKSFSGRIAKLEGVSAKPENRVNNRINRACKKLDLLHGKIDINSPFAVKTLIKAAEKYFKHPEYISFREFLTDNLGINSRLYHPKIRIKAIEQLGREVKSPDSTREAMDFIYLMTFAEPYDEGAEEKQIKLFSPNSENQASNFIKQIISLEGDELGKFLSTESNKVYFKKLIAMPIFLGHILIGSIPRELSPNEQLKAYSKVLKLVIEQEKPILNRDLHTGIIEQFNEQAEEKANKIQKQAYSLLKKYYDSDTEAKFTEFIQTQENENEAIRGINLNQLLTLLMKRTAANKLKTSGFDSGEDRITQIQTQSLPSFVSFLYTLLKDSKIEQYDLQKIQTKFFSQEMNRDKHINRAINSFMDRPDKVHQEVLDFSLLEVLYKLSSDCLSFSYRNSPKEIASLEDSAKESTPYQQKTISVDKNSLNRLIEFVKKYKAATNAPAHGAA